MKRLGKAIGVILAATLAVGMTACQSKDNGKAASGNSPDTSATAEASGSKAELDYTFGEGQTFHSNTPVTYSMMYSDHEN